MKANLRKTKIVCTIGPASEDKLEELFEAGLNVARINYSHALARVGNARDHEFEGTDDAFCGVTFPLFPQKLECLCADLLGCRGRLRRRAFDGERAALVDFGYKRIRLAAVGEVRFIQYI